MGFVAFHGTRALSFVSSVIITGIMAYFTYHLQQAGFQLPWVFILMMTTSLLTLLNFGLTVFLYCSHRRFILLSLISNSFLLILWAVSFGLLSWNMSKTLQHACPNIDWDNDVALIICRVYKALYSFIVIGFVAQIFIVALDVIARRRLRGRGEYNAMGYDAKHSQRESMVSGGHLNGATRAPTKRQSLKYHDYENLNSSEKGPVNDVQDSYDTVPTHDGLPSGNRPERSPSPEDPLTMDEFSAYDQTHRETRYDPVDYR